MTRSATHETQLFFEQDMEQPQLHHVAEGQAAVFSARSPGKQTPNEDAAAVIHFSQGCGVLVVADGLGGIRAGEQASRRAVESVRAALLEAAEKQLPMRTGILNGIELANTTLCDSGIGGCTTLSLVEIQHRVVRPYHVGDSLIVVVGGRSRIKLQTVCHSPTGFAVESGLLDEAEAMHHEDRHIVSNVIGSTDMRIEIGSELKLAPRDTLLLASDGLPDNLHTEEFVETLRKGSLDSSARTVVADARRRMIEPRSGEPSKPDDLTFVVYRPG